VTRLLAVILLALSPSATVLAAEKPADKPAEAAKPAEPAAQPAPADAASADVASRVEREQLKREVMDEVKKALDKQKEEVRDEVRAQVATQTANKALEEEFQFHEEKKKLDLFEVNGYFRVRPELFYKFDMQRGADPAGYYLFHPPANDVNRVTLSDANMRWRLEPTLNVSEDVRIHAQIDMLDNLILGSTPDGGFGFSQRTPITALSGTQVPPTSDKNWVQNSVTIKRVWGEVNTPVGQFVFGRMGSQWGMGILTSSGSNWDSDYGDTVDRIMFVAKVADHYIVPMLTFASSGTASIRKQDLTGQPYDLAQLDDVHDYGIAIARRDTDLEINRKLQAGQYILNYGVYFTYRRQSLDATNSTAPYSDGVTPASFFSRDAQIYTPDIWIKFQTKKLRLELEAVGVFGKIGNPNDQADLGQAITLRQFGAAASGNYKILDALDVSLEAGFASGDKAPGMGNLPGRGPTQPGSIDGAQFCVTSSCKNVDTDMNNFRFNQDYRVDMILWREIFNGITDAFYIKPTVKYEITEGLGVWASLIYSRAIYGESTPSSHLDATTGQLVGDPNLGVEIDGGVRYDSGDGFTAGISYGVLFPLAGMANNIANPTIDASTAQTVRGWFVIKY
jgi:uncharacterized protein (TIGR04551 family)